MVFNLRNRTYLLFLVPALVIYGSFIIYPLAAALLYSLFSWDGLIRTSFAGMHNFERLFTQYPFSFLFWNALKHNTAYFLVTFFWRNSLALIVALLLHRALKGATFFKTILFIPKLLSPIVVGFLWNLILNPNFGVLNKLLTMVGLGNLARPWLGDPATALGSIIAADTWYWVGFSMIIFLAGLQTIPDETLEAARIDGASGWKLFWTVTFPLLWPSLTIVTILTFVHAFNIFDLVYALAGSSGSPYYATDLLALFFYRSAFGEMGGAAQDIGLGSALAVVMFVIIFGFTAIVSYLMKRYDATN